MVDELLLLLDDDATSVAPSPPVADSSCLLIVMMLMLIDTSGDGVIGTWFSNANSYDGVWIVDTSVASDDDVVVKEASADRTISNGAVATLLNEA